MSLRIVIDANVILSGGMNVHGPPGRLLAYWFAGGWFTVYTSRTLLLELDDVLGRARVQRYFERAGSSAWQLLDLVQSHAVTVKTPSNSRSFSRDPDDDAVIEAAIAAGADYIVSGDRDLLDLGEVEGIPVVTVADFLERLEAAPDVP